MQLKNMVLLLWMMSLPLLADQTSKERTYVLLLFNITAQAKFDAFRQGTKDAFSNAGGRVERELQLAKPRQANETVGVYNRAVLVSYDTKQGHQQFTESKSYKKYKPLLVEGTDKVVLFTANSSLDTKGQAGADAVFLIKLSWYGEQADLPTMESQISALNKELSPYGFHEDRVLRNPTTAGLEVGPNRVTVMFMASREAQIQFTQNKELAGKVHQFNQAWLKEAIYFGGGEIKP